MTNKIKVVAAAVSATGATFYTEDGEAVPISVTNNRVSEMIAQVMEAVQKGNIPVEVDTSTYSVFTKIEEESKGFMRFFRVAKKKVQDILGIRAERGPVNGDGFVSSVPKNEKGEVVSKVQPGTEPVNQTIREELVKAQDEAEKANLDDKDTTVVAVVGDTPIVGAEALAGHAKAAVVSGETIGFQNLMKRLGGVAKDRKHTVQEALVFLKEMDLPFANDGSIIAYKSLSETGTEGVFIDNHSKSLKQGVGTLVQMDVELVDDNRRVLCSNGLHVARRGYLGGYGTGRGHVVCLIKIAPEDVISVPMNEQSKMRVRAYHIVAKLSDADMGLISKQKSFTAERMDQASLLAKVVRGDHVPVLNITTQHSGRNIDQMVPVTNPVTPIITGNQKVSHTIEEETGKPLDVKSINEKMEENQKEKVPEKVSESQALDPVDAPKAKEPSPKAPAKKAPAKPKASKAKKPGKAAQTQKPKAKAPVASKAAPKPPAPKPPIKTETLDEKHGAPAKEGSNAYALYALWKSHKTKASFDALLAFKKQKKKSWAALGLAPNQISEIEKELKK